MTDTTKITSVHLRRKAFVYVRQSTVMQVARNRESTDRQYGLLTRAMELGWPREQVTIVDDDLGVSGSGLVERAGFGRLAAEVALAHVGIVLALEVSRWLCRKFDDCKWTDSVCSWISQAVTSLTLSFSPVFVGIYDSH